jgi:hypothetical protein
MSAIFRIFFIVAGAITALFVARDALNFTIIQTFVAVLLVTATLLAGSLLSLRRKACAHSFAASGTGEGALGADCLPREFMQLAADASKTAALLL